MDFGKYTLILLTAVVGGALSACDIMKASTECLPKLGEIGPMMGQAMQDGSAMNQMCSKVEEVKNCVEENIKDCDENSKAPMKQAFASLDMFKQKCDPNNPCSLKKMMDCIKDAPKDDKINYAEACKVLPKLMTCMNNLKTQCSSDETIKMTVSSSAASLNQADAECKKLYGANYATDMQKGNNNNNNDDGSGASQIAGFSFFMLVFAFTAWFGL